MAERIAAPLRLSTRAIYSSKWTVFQRWCTEEQVDFRNPFISDICNFFWYLFNVPNRCPSTIEGYRTAIAGTLRNSKLYISTNVDVAKLIASFYRDKPKSSRPIPKWNLSIVLHRLTRPPFESQEDAAPALKTLKTRILYSALSVPSGVIWTKPMIPEWVDIYCLSHSNWAVLRIFSVLQSCLGSKTP